LWVDEKRLMGYAFMRYFVNSLQRNRLICLSEIFEIGTMASFRRAADGGKMIGNGESPVEFEKQYFSRLESV
jgi:hypothetical protein